MRPLDRPPLVTDFGGGGFIGRHVCEALLRQGVRILIAQRNPLAAHVVQPLGQVGQIGYRQADLTNRASVDRAVEGADMVINLVGTFGAMETLHVEGARTVAEAAAAAKCLSLVHVSAIGADRQSSSRYGRTKGEGEAAVRKAFPGATIIQPSVVFGPEDELTNRFAGLGKLPVVPVLKPDVKFQPVYVVDLARAIARAALEPATHGGKTYEIGGPQVFSMIELHRAIYAVSGQSPGLLELPDVSGDILSRFGFLPGAPITRDQWLMMQEDNVASGTLPGFEAFGIRPAPLAAVAESWLTPYRNHGRFAAPSPY